MSITEFIQELKALSSEALRREYIKNGANDKVLGLKFTYLQYYKKEIGKNHDYALKLWETQIPELQILATMLTSKKHFSVQLIEEWNNDIDFYLLSDAFIGNILTPYGGSLSLANKWIYSDKEYTLRHAYSIIFMLAKENGFMKDEAFLKYLVKIEEDIKTAPNRAKETMLYSVLNIGRRSRKLNDEAIAVMERLGQIHIEHGTTGSITPDVLSILKVVKKAEGYIFYAPGDMI